MFERGVTDAERRAHNAAYMRGWLLTHRDRVNAIRRARAATDKGREARRRQDAAYIATGGRAATVARQALHPMAAERRAIQHKRVADNRDVANAKRKAYTATDKGREAKRKDDAAFVTSGGRARVEAKRATRPLSAARRANRQKWAAANTSYYTASRAKRRGLEKELTPFEFWVLREAVELCRLREVVVGGKWHVDHIVPVSKGGHSRPDNLQVVPAIWNRRKSNVHAERFFGAKEES